MPKSLHEQINDVVVFYLEEKLRTNTPVDVAAMAREITQSLVDMIMEQDEQNQAPLLAQIITSLGDEYLQRRDLIPTEHRDN
jgi:DNA-binding protein Fis